MLFSKLAQSLFETEPDWLTLIIITIKYKMYILKGHYRNVNCYVQELAEESNLKSASCLFLDVYAMELFNRTMA